MTQPKRYDYVIIGSGSAAFAGAIKAADYGARVAVVERGTIGGTCVNVGCVPSKRLLIAGDHYFYKADGFQGIEFNGGALQFQQVVEQKDVLVAGFRKAKYEDVIASLPKTDYIHGQAVFEGPHRLRVNGTKIEAKQFLIATGSSPTAIPVPGVDTVRCLTNVEALDLREVPQRLLVIGAGAVGLEFAQLYAHFGSAVTVFELMPRVLPGMEPDVSDALRQYLEDERIRIYTGARVTRLEERGTSRSVHAVVDGHEQRFEGDEVLMAAGRRPNTRELGLEKLGVRLRRDGAVEVDRQMRSSLPHIWAAGDVTGQPMLETFAAKQGAVATENALGGASRVIDPIVPQAVFTTPQVATVGLTEAEVMPKYHACACRTLPMGLVPKAAILGDTRGLIKMIIHPKNHRVLGVHIVARHAAEMIHEATLAVKFRLTIEDLIDTLHVFPTMSEALKLVAQSFYKDVAKLSCCTE